MTIIDIGFDANRDRHCDLDGWFVNRYGNHRPVLREYKGFEEIPYISESFKGRRILDAFHISYTTYSGLELSPLKNYSLNDEDLDFSSPKINSYLRSDRNNPYANLYVFEIDKLMGIFYLKEDIQVYRGINCDLSKNYVREIINLKIGDIYSDKAYLSTSLSLETASNYTMKGNGPLIIMDIKLARGTRCVPLIYKNATNNQDDFEILVRRGKKFLVKDKMITNINGREFYYFKLESIS